MIIFLLLLADIALLQQFDQPYIYLAERFKALQENQLCRANSPFNDLKYGNQKVKDVKGIYFCDTYAKRTCCSEDNFNDLKLRWFKQYSQSIDLSPQCQELFTALVCYDCDGDVGQGTRDGICITFCDKLYHSCYFDLFQVDENNKKLRLCKKNDIFCSQLKFIEQNGESFCRSMGLKVNTNTNFEEWIDDLLANTTKKEPTCWDSTSSSKIFGPAYDFDKTKIFDEFKEKFKDLKNLNVPSSKYLNYITYFGVSVVAALVIYLVYLMKRN